MPPRDFDGRRVLEARTSLGLTQLELGRRVGATDVAVSSWERGEQKPDPTRLTAIADALEQDLDTLFPRSAAPDLADLRCDAGIPQNKIGELIGAGSHTPVAYAEKGRRRLGEKYVAPLAGAYGVTIDELRAAQERSFGIEVPMLAPTSLPRPPEAPRTIAEKIEYLLSETYTSPLDRPTDAMIAGRANAKAGRRVLSAEAVFALRTGAAEDASPDVLNALAGALGVPAVVFSDDAGELARFVTTVRKAGKAWQVMAARGAVREEGVAELLEFINETFDDLLTPDAAHMLPSRDRTGDTDPQDVRASGEPS